MARDDRTQAVIERQAGLLKAQPTALRRCLKCDYWFHSTGADHRLCNVCQHEPKRPGSLVGERIAGSPRRKMRTQDDW